MRILANSTTLPLFAPVGAVVVTWAALTWIEPIPEMSATPLRLVPILLLGVGAVLAAYFKLSNAVLQFMLLAVTQAVLTYAGTLPDTEAARVLGLALLLIPISFVLLGALDDRGLLTYDGLMRWLTLGFAAALAALIVALAPQVVTAVLSVRLIPLALPMPQPALAASGSAMAIALVMFLRRGTPMEAGTLAALLTMVAALSAPPASAEGTLLVSAAGLILIVSVLQSGYRLAFLDELTCLPGRRALELQLKRLSSPCAVAMIDVDFFKKFNDSYGHDVGDQALRMVARCLRQVGNGGQAYRYGGEEFTVLFPGRTALEAAPTLEDLRALIATTPFRLRSTDRPKSKRARSRRGNGGGAKILHLTVSIGLAERTDAHRHVDAVKAADKALYRAKSRGRNQVAR